ncbi:MAG: RnfH family protein [Lautropia sp.]|nr:RnfH family protein [Lautropia sp.]
MTADMPGTDDARQTHHRAGDTGSGETATPITPVSITPALISVELVVQQEVPDTSPRAYTLDRSMHRVASGTTIRQLISQHAANLATDIEARHRGLSRFGKRAWLDDPLQPDDRIEIMLPILADAKAARFQRVAQTRARARKTGQKAASRRRPVTPRQDA